MLLCQGLRLTTLPIHTVLDCNPIDMPVAFPAGFYLHPRPSRRLSAAVSLVIGDDNDNNIDIDIDIDNIGIVFG